MSDQSRPQRGRDDVEPDRPDASPDPGRATGTPQTSSQSSAPGAQAFALVDRATDSLRSRRDPRWVEISDRVLSRALRATRRSYPVRAMTATGPVHVSEQVLITYLRAAVQDDVPDAALLHIRIDIDGRDTLGGVTLALVARYGVELVTVGDRIRDLTTARLGELLGPVQVPVTVDRLHVHFSDVIDGDPHQHDPWTS